MKAAQNNLVCIEGTVEEAERIMNAIMSIYDQVEFNSKVAKEKTILLELAGQLQYAINGEGNKNE
jgi:hypothetical protein